MIDWLYSKLAVLIAAFLILASLVGLLGAVNGSLRGLQAEIVAERIADLLDTMSAAQGETTATLTVASPGERGMLPRTIAREPYFVLIYWDYVRLYREAVPDRHWRIAPLLQPVYLGSPPTDGELNESELGAIETTARVDGLLVRPLRDIHVARAWVLAGGQTRFLTFVYA